MKSKSAILVFFLSAMLGCGQETARETMSPAAEGFAAALAGAESALAEAEANRNVWSKTDALLKQALLAYEAGRIDEATDLANEVRLQAELASTQVTSEKERWRARVVSD